MMGGKATFSGFWLCNRDIVLMGDKLLYSAHSFLLEVTADSSKVTHFWYIP